MFHVDSFQSMSLFGVLMFNFSFVDCVDIFDCICGINLCFIELNSLFHPNAKCLYHFLPFSGK